MEKETLLRRFDFFSKNETIINGEILFKVQ